MLKLLALSFFCMVFGLLSVQAQDYKWVGTWNVTGKWEGYEDEEWHQKGTATFTCSVVGNNLKVILTSKANTGLPPNATFDIPLSSGTVSAQALSVSRTMYLLKKSSSNDDWCECAYVPNLSCWKEITETEANSTNGETGNSAVTVELQVDSKGVISGSFVFNWGCGGAGSSTYTFKSSAGGKAKK